jgi:REP element-mobilizing transposase RayT
MWYRSKMSRMRKLSGQIDLPMRDPNKPMRGGKRKNAGRPPKGLRSSERHKRRPAHDRRHPVHVTMRLVDGVISLRKRDMYLAVREATIAVLGREGFRICYLSIQRNHLHLLVEATGKRVLSRGLQAFQISAAKHINAAITARMRERRRGRVFADRYNSRALTSPRAVRHAICYVLNNWRRHEEDRAKVTKTWKLDPFSNAIDFPGWKERDDSPFLYRPPRSYQQLVTWLPKTWLLREGWKKHGMISVFEVPGPMHKPKIPRRKESKTSVRH